ncbi:hypothetical protein C5E46_30760 [Nocardia nova]|nr:hypothetical protein C5E46_30760 [Nocardia nova]
MESVDSTSNHHEVQSEEDARIMTTVDIAPVPLRQHHVEVLNYFGTCPECGYAAEAALLITTYTDGSHNADPIGRCGLPCGWTGPVLITTMTAVAPPSHGN